MKKVFVGLSGGVDSAVSAALLKEQGYDVTGVFIKVWQPDFLPCTWREERRDAMRVAATLNIPFLFFDFENEYKRGVADHMIEEYKKGRTPNPDILCNREIKFGAFWDKAKSFGADFIATGHYARILKAKPSESLRFSLLEGVDKEKDQSYFLWTLTKEDLEHTLFPVGDLGKNEVRSLAKKFKLPVAEKSDSQGICFLGDVDIGGFLSHFIEIKPGDALDVQGKIIGRHKGAILYTLGERHGFEINEKLPNSNAFFVVDKNVEKNTITVSSNQTEIDSSLPKQAELIKLNWISSPKNYNLEARIRYRQKKISVTLRENTLKFKTPQSAAAGQSVVFYNDETVLGGGIIA